MNTVHREGSRTVIRQVPIALLLVGALFGLPPFAWSIYLFVTGIDADGKYFCLFFGLLMLWLFGEYVATRERIEIDRESGRLTREVAGVFRRARQEIDLRGAAGLAAEHVRVPSIRGTGWRWRVLLLAADGARHLLNSPEKVYLDHRAFARLVADAAGLPYLGETEIEPG